MFSNPLKKVITGWRYMKTWPMVKQLGYYFPEFRVIKATRLGLLLMPVLALCAAIGQIYLYGWDFLPQAIALFLFFISFPIQGLIWLGWRAAHPLPLTLFDWGNKLNTKLVGLGVNSPQLGANASYQDIAQILKLAFEKLEASYWEEI